MTDIATEQRLIQSPHVELPWMAKLINTPLPQGESQDSTVQTIILGFHSTPLITHYLIAHRYPIEYGIDLSVIGIRQGMFDEMVLQPHTLTYYQIDSVKGSEASFDLSKHYSQKCLPLDALRMHIENPFSTHIETLVASLSTGSPERSLRPALLSIISSMTDQSSKLVIRDRVLARAGISLKIFDAMIASITEIIK